MNFLLLIAIFTLSLSEEFKELKSYIERVEKGDMDLPYDAIYDYEKIVPNNPIYLYLRGLIEFDGEKSMNFYKRLYSSDPNHEYADDAAMKIGEYYYSKGLYVQASDWLKKMPVYYPRSDNCEMAVDLFLKSLIISGKKDTAMFYLKIIKSQIPNIKIDDQYNDLLAQTKKSPIPLDIPQNLGQSYHLQVGVYKDYSNARKVRDILNLKGFDARIEHTKINNKRLYTVLEGIYSNSDDAQKTSNKIKEKISYNSIVKKTD
jgi:tetratricopeptide (TPR) repeat protein